MNSYRSRRHSPAKPISGVLARILQPAVRKRGLAGADLIMAWPDLVGPQFSPCTMPDRIVWPKSVEDEAAPGTLVVRCAGPAAILLQHEAPLIVERVNAFLGWYAIARLKIVQGPIGAPDDRSTARLPEVPPERKAALERQVAGVADPRLREALARLGAGAVANALARADGEDPSG